MNQLIASGKRKISNRVDGIELNLPFLSISVCPDDLEQQVAREIVIRLADRRVLNASECCDNCIDDSLGSLNEIRSSLVEQQVKLSKSVDGPLYLLVELMLTAIRQFLTWEQRRQQKSSIVIATPSQSEFRRPWDEREEYFAALEMLRAHLFKCLAQIARIADINVPKITESMRYDNVWALETYVPPPSLEQSNA